MKDLKHMLMLIKARYAHWNNQLSLATSSNCGAGGSCTGSAGCSSSSGDGCHGDGSCGGDGD